MSWRTLLTLVLATAALTGTIASAHPAARRTRPNVLLVITDDQRADTIRFLPKIRQWLKQRGATFTDAYATTPVCCPARASIFTGRYAHNHGVLTNRQGDAQGLDQSTTVQRRLQRAGYFTSLTGKYLNGWPLRSEPPGFDDFATLKRGGYYDRVYNINGTLRKVERYSTDFMSRRAVHVLRRLESSDSRPWFLVIATWAPHMRAVPELKYRRARVSRFEPNAAMLERNRRDKPRYVHDDPVRLDAAARRRSRQIRTLKSVDDLVGRLLTTLRTLGEGRNTLTMLLSDNGLMWEEHGLWGKGFPYRQSIRIPLLARWPGRIHAGRDDRIAANIDVAPTVLDAAGMSVTGVDGRSLLRPSERRRLLVEVFGSSRRPTLKWASTVTPRLQYTEYAFGTPQDPAFVEYYDLRHDPWQLRNLLGDGRAGNDPVTRWLSEQLARDRACAGAACP
jgi:arylsulfatase A-like enzyme